MIRRLCGLLDINFPIGGWTQSGRPVGELIARWLLADVETRNVAQTWVATSDGMMLCVSTVFLVVGVDDRFDGTMPYLYETLVFVEKNAGILEIFADHDDPDFDFGCRYLTREKALEGHVEHVEYFRQLSGYHLALPAAPGDEAQFSDNELVFPTPDIEWRSVC